jgi:hypothetical protein
MSQLRFRQLARLEKRALPYLERKRRYAEEQKASSRENAFVIVANLALLILYGDPRIGEPLSFAWRRCLDSPAWKACREKHPDYIGRHGRDEEGPFSSWGAGWIAQYFRKYFLPELPGVDETEKLNAVFAKAPAWLLWFTHGEIAGLMGSTCRTFQASPDSPARIFVSDSYRMEPLNGVGYRMVPRTNGVPWRGSTGRIDWLFRII